METVQRSVQRRAQPVGHYNHLAQQNQRPSSVIYTGTSGDLWANQEGMYRLYLIFEIIAYAI